MSIETFLLVLIVIQGTVTLIASYYFNKTIRMYKNLNNELLDLVSRLVVMDVLHIGSEIPREKAEKVIKKQTKREMAIEEFNSSNHKIYGVPVRASMAEKVMKRQIEKKTPVKNKVGRPNK